MLIYSPIKASPELHWIHWCGSYRGRWPRAGWSLWLMLFIWQLVCLWSLKCPCSPSTVPADTTNTLGAVSVPFPLIRLHSAWIIPRFQWSGQQSLSYRQGPKWGPVKSKNWKEIDLEGKTDVIHLNSRRWCLGLKGPLWKYWTWCLQTWVEIIKYVLVFDIDKPRKAKCTAKVLANEKSI